MQDFLQPSQLMTRTSLFSVIFIQTVLQTSCLTPTENSQLLTTSLPSLNYLNSNRTDDLIIIIDSNKTSSDQAVILDSNCTFAFENFLDVVVNFTRCTVKYARPIHICMACVADYREMQRSYNNLKKQQKDCTDFFFASDQLGIVDIVYSSGNDLWSKSFCQDCFDHLNETMHFFQAFAELMTCIENSNTSTFLSPNNTCVECQPIFANLTEVFNGFVSTKNEFNPNICMDIVDTMNTSRRTWSEYKCVVGFDTNIGILNVLTCLAIGIIPVMFYLLANNIARLEDVKIVKPKRKITTVTVSAPDRSLET